MEQKFLEDRDQRVLASSSKYRRAERVFSSPDAPDAGSGSNNGTFDVSTDEVWVRNIQFTRDSSPMAVSTPFGKQLK